MEFTYLFQIVLFHYVNCLGCCTAGGKKQTALKMCLLTIIHEYDWLLMSKMYAINLLNYSHVLRSLILSTVVLLFLFLSRVQYNFN